MSGLSAEPAKKVAFEQGSGSLQYQGFSSPVPGGSREVYVTCGYRRCRDFDGPNMKGQDYCAVVAGGGYVVGVVADGVSQSFYGDVAARKVAEHLLDTLWGFREAPPEPDKLASRLRWLSEGVDKDVREHRLSAPETSILRKALERTRAKGSQTIFAAFVLDGHQGRLHLYQLGDAYAWIHSHRGVPILEPADRLGRWSSAGGGNLHLKYVNQCGVVGIVIHSDGARREWGEKLTKPEVLREDFEREVSARADLDDIAFVAAHLREGEKKLRPAAEEARDQEVKGESVSDDMDFVAARLPVGNSWKPVEEVRDNSDTRVSRRPLPADFGERSPRSTARDPLLGPNAPGSNTLRSVGEWSPLAEEPGRARSGGLSPWLTPWSRFLGALTRPWRRSSRVSQTVVVRETRRVRPDRRLAGTRHRGRLFGPLAVFLLGFLVGSATSWFLRREEKKLAESTASPPSGSPAAANPPPGATASKEESDPQSDGAGTEPAQTKTKEGIEALPERKSERKRQVEKQAETKGKRDKGERRDAPPTPKKQEPN
jgi:hypothetical protein